VCLIMLLPSRILCCRLNNVMGWKKRCISLAFIHQHHLQTPNRVAHRCYHKTGALYLNRILFDTSEIDCIDDTKSTDSTIDDGTHHLATVTLPKDDYRTIHVAKILGLHNGDTIRAGSVRSPKENENNPLAGLISDNATVTWLPEGKTKKAQPTKSGDPPGSLQISIPHPPKTTLRNDTLAEGDHNDTRASRDNAKTPVSLLLALPRPLQLQRILPMVSQLGIDQLILTNAKKVPKDYFGSHLFRKPEVLRNCLIEGLAISGDVQLPNVTVTKRLKIFMEDELDSFFPREDVVRVIAHPQRKKSHSDGDDSSKEGGFADDGLVDEVKRMTEISFPDGIPRRILVAVGPEGGWDEPYEIDMFKENGFQQVTCGTRVLRSDVAVVSLLALAHEICASSYE